jgi:acetyl esterase
MPLAPEIEALLRSMSTQPPMHQVPIATLRQTRPRIGANDIQPVGAVADGFIPSQAGPIPVRHYAPAGSTSASAGTGPRPMVVFFHGGGFVFGSIDGYYDHVCRVICSQAECHVMSVAYRLAPENKFPAATEDCWAAVQWAHAHGHSLGADPNRILVAGGSAGANLAAVTALRARDESWPALIGQLLFYPLTDFHRPPTRSMLAYEEGYYLTRADIVWFWEQYIASDRDALNPYAAPLQAKSLNGLPAALVITAEYDPLRDEGERYAARLRESGVRVQLTRYPGMIHGFMAFPTPLADVALRESVAWARARFAGI